MRVRRIDPSRLANYPLVLILATLSPWLPNDYEVQLHQVVHQVFTEKCKKFSGAVLDVPSGSVESEMPLGRDRLRFGLAYNGGKSDLVSNALERKPPYYFVVRRAGGSGCERFT